MFVSILVPVKLSDPDHAGRSVEVAARLAHDCDAWLTLATITPHWVTIQDADYSWEARRWFEARAATELEALKSKTDYRRCRTHSRWGSVPGSVLDIAEDIGADLIVLPAREPSLIDLFHRSDAIRIAAKTDCSVLLVK